MRVHVAKFFNGEPIPSWVARLSAMDRRALRRTFRRKGYEVDGDRILYGTKTVGKIVRA